MIFLIQFNDRKYDNFKNKSEFESAVTFNHDEVILQTKVSNNSRCRDEVSIQQ